MRGYKWQVYIASNRRRLEIPKIHTVTPLPATTDQKHALPKPEDEEGGTVLEREKENENRKATFLPIVLTSFHHHHEHEKEEVTSPALALGWVR